jgi:hypothetical protein
MTQAWLWCMKKDLMALKRFYSSVLADFLLRSGRTPCTTLCSSMSALGTLLSSLLGSLSSLFSFFQSLVILPNLYSLILSSC